MPTFDPISVLAGAASGVFALPAERLVPASTQKPRDLRTEEDRPEARKLRKSAQEFESALVSSWWQEMQNSFQDPDTEQEAGLDTLQQLGFQSMAMGMAASGGIGLARMVFHQLAPALGRDRPSDGVTGGIKKG